jgi:hypothetical protein
MAPQLFAVSSAPTPPPANTRKHTHSEIPLLLYEGASGQCFFGSLGAVSQGQDKEQLLSWMNDSHPKFLTFILKILQGIVFFGSLADVSRGQNKEQLLSWMDDSHPPNSLLSSSGCLPSSLVPRQQLTCYLFNIRVSMRKYPCGMVLCI